LTQEFKGVKVRQKEQRMEEQIVRRNYTPEQKYKIVKEQLTTKTGIAEITKKYGISSSNFYRWQEEFFNGALERLKNGKAQDGFQVGPTF
jgi:transposase-like protein